MAVFFFFNFITKKICFIVLVGIILAVQTFIIIPAICKYYYELNGLKPGYDRFIPLYQELTIFPEALAKSQSFSKDDVTTNYKYYSFIDFVKLIENDKDFVENLSGVTYDGTSINLAKLDHVETITSILEKLHNSSMLESYNPFFRSEELTGIYMEIGAKMDSELPPSILTILNSKFDSLGYGI